MLPIDMSLLAGWLPQQRWFGGKGAAIASVRDVDRAQISPGLILATVEVSYREGRPPERYALALKPWTGTPGIVEGLDDDAARGLLGIVREKRRIATAAGALQGLRFDTKGSDLDGLAPVPTVRRLSAEQSNTSLVFDDKVIVKLIRRLEPGVNPELEMGAFLARRGFTATPPLLGGIALEGAVNATAAVAHRFVRVESDGWTYLLTAFQKGSLPLDEIRELGTRVGEMHAALASDPSDPAFAPESIIREDLARWSEALLRELDQTVRAARGTVPEIEARKPQLEARIRAFAKVEPGGVRIRQHGDLHLGQVLRSGGHWMIFDFEGEPARNLEERRAKHSPFKDVAGMLRSLAYAAGAVEVAGGPPQREPLARAREEFLRGWRGAAAKLVPADAQRADAMLRALELEKLLYEIRYEVGHRPDWVRIPARDLFSETER
ncbi:MAG: sugar phosphotransferase [Deltaproteobacteria bacterium]|nr:MAG: sugar phosphotransferase [Deltaproteobacteria bacterium]TMB34393.1 MAG: sugar phosphotransferase [Deltaproteobacteria bacterium]